MARETVDPARGGYQDYYPTPPDNAVPPTDPARDGYRTYYPATPDNGVPPVDPATVPGANDPRRQL